MNREKIGEMLKEYHPEYNEDTENYSYAEKGMQRVWEVSGYEEERKETTVSGARGTDSTSEVRTIAKRTKQLFLEQGVMNFIGTTISSPQDLAEMAQIYRNPNFEVFHIFYIKNTMLIGMEAVTSRLPFLISLKELHGMDTYQYVKEKMTHIGADGYYIVHNHPSGKIFPSGPDIATTNRFVSRIPGFLGHIILDHTEYLEIHEDLSFESHSIPEGKQVEVREFLEGDPSLLQYEISDSGELSAFGQMVKKQEYTSLLIYCENKGRVCEIEEVTNGFIRGPECKKHLKQHLYGGLVAKAYLYTDDERLFFDRIELIREGYVEDLVCKTERGHISAIGNRHRKDANILLAGETEDDLRNIVKGEFFTVERKRVKRRSR